MNCKAVVSILALVLVLAFILGCLVTRTPRPISGTIIGVGFNQIGEEKKYFLLINCEEGRKEVAVSDDLYQLLKDGRWTGKFFMVGPPRNEGSFE